MELGGNAQQNFPDSIKRQPRDYQAQGESRCPRQPGQQRTALSFCGAECFVQAGGADDAILMLGDAFTTVKMAALRAACRSFAHGVIQALPLVEMGHVGYG